MRFAVAIAVLLCAWVDHAGADLYRWVDPETGSVKFSSYPPPWFNDPAAQRRAPKVEVIAPSRVAPAFGAAPADGREPAARTLESEKKAVAAENSPPEDRREALLKLLAQRTAALIASPPEAMGKVYIEVIEAQQELEKLDRQLASADPTGETPRLEAKWRIAVPLEAQRTLLLQQLASQGAPPPGAPRDRIESAWANTQRLLGALGWVDGAIVNIDPRKANARHFEMNELIDRIAAQWEPYVDPGAVRKSRGR